jgi:GcrA cell cycle regulator
MQTDWPLQHSEALREYFARGLSYSRIARAINERFNTSYTRNAALGRAKRMGLAGPDQPRTLPNGFPRRPQGPRKSRLAESPHRHVPQFTKQPPSRPVKMPKLRCVELVPRHLSVVDLEPGDCRYPYGGDHDGEAITFCGHPRQQDSSYCTAHFHLTRVTLKRGERAKPAVSLRLVEVA